MRCPRQQNGSKVETSCHQPTRSGGHSSEKQRSSVEFALAPSAASTPATVTGSRLKNSRSGRRRLIRGAAPTACSSQNTAVKKRPDHRCECRNIMTGFHPLLPIFRTIQDGLQSTQSCRSSQATRMGRNVPIPVYSVWPGGLDQRLATLASGISPLRHQIVSPIMVMVRVRRRRNLLRRWDRRRPCTAPPLERGTAVG
jgi:hypothetical protein